MVATKGVLIADVPTARGDVVRSDQLVFTLMHEHTFNLSPEINQNYPETWGEDLLSCPFGKTNWPVRPTL
jgi:hypothetical protein